MKFNPYKYQQQAIKFMLSRSSAGLFLDMGLGKTAITLSVLKELKQKAIVIAPLRVCYNVWKQESDKWGFGFTFHIIHKKTKYINNDADIQLINPEGIEYLVKNKKELQSSVLIVDESSKFKNPSSKRFKMLKQILYKFDRKYILSGTPAPQSLLDLWSQIFILDNGESLGTPFGRYRNTYFKQRGSFGFLRMVWDLAHPHYFKEIMSNLSDRVLSMKAEDYLDMPELIFNNIYFELDAKHKKMYKDLEDEMITSLDGDDIIADSSISKYLMCRQFSGGAFYDENKDVVEVHTKKIDTLKEVVEALNGKPVLIFYYFRHEYLRLKKNFPDGTYLKSGMKEDEIASILQKWNNKQISLLFVPSRMLNDGVNLQQGGNDIIWFTLTDSLETYLQANARIYRQGVKGNVRIHHLLGRNTLDELMLKRVNDKKHSHLSIYNYLKQELK